jgi:hypothetical protein
MERDMTDLIKFVIEMDPELVCKNCGTNDHVHYNYTIFHTGGIARDDELGEIGVWCDFCNGDTEMVHPDEAEWKQCPECKLVVESGFIDTESDNGTCHDCLDKAEEAA